MSSREQSRWKASREDRDEGAGSHHVLASGTPPCPQSGGGEEEVGESVEGAGVRTFWHATEESCIKRLLLCEFLKNNTSNLLKFPKLLKEGEASSNYCYSCLLPRDMLSCSPVGPSQGDTRQVAGREHLSRPFPGCLLGHGVTCGWIHYVPLWKDAAL